RTLLWRLYQRSSKDIEETKKLLELYYTLRLKNPKIFIKRDPSDVDTDNMYKYLHIAPLSQLTPESYHITCIHFHNLDTKMIHFTEDIKTYVMIGDCHFLQPDVILENNNGQLSKGEIIIIDMEGITMKHVAALSMGTLSVFFKYLYQAYPNRMQAVHMINCPSYINKILGFLRPFMSKELYEMIKCHTNGLESLYESLPREILPKEYGGNAGTMAELSSEFRKKVFEMKSLLMDPEYWTVQKS
ncbi:alpha-tocopherol transfer protein-like, partial [Musca vetustissima]|uniref:alpha-tocopherol transfer protein-like n=1 Tax=Musca vetustissima TaxID=27455 RepID=UPI002AB774CB